MSKHTPGPWYLEREGPGNRVVRNKDISVAEILDDCYPDAEQEIANALLVTAAPDYHTAAEAFRDAVLNGRHQLEGTLDNDQTNAVLSLFDEVFWSAIAKATGEQS